MKRPILTTSAVAAGPVTGPFLYLFGVYVQADRKVMAAWMVAAMILTPAWLAKLSELMLGLYGRLL